MHDGRPISEKIDASRCAGVVPLRVGFVCVFSPSDPTALSGMPFHMQRALEAAGAEIIPLVAELTPGSPMRAARRVRSALGRPLPPGLKRSLRRAMRRTQRRAQPLIDTFAARSGRDLAVRSAAGVVEAVRGQSLDVLFGCSISVPLAGLDTPIPIVYFTDITARLINGAYPEFARRGRAYRTSCDDIERRALNRAAIAVFSSQWARASALQHYGVPERRTRVVPMGANIVPLSPQPARPAPKKPGTLRMCIVAADPVRKRLDIAIATTEALAARGWSAELLYVGPEDKRVRRSTVVRHVGCLRLSRTDDRNRLGRVLMESDLMLLPSSAEAYGIAPCEAAHFGCPSVVSDAGGLPEVVLHDETGLVLPVAADAEDWAEAIDAMILCPGAYSSMSSAALRRARSRLSWDVWARAMMRIFREAVSQHSL